MFYLLINGTLPLIVPGFITGVRESIFSSVFVCRSLHLLIWKISSTNGQERFKEDKKLINDIIPVKFDLKIIRRESED